MRWPLFFALLFAVAAPALAADKNNLAPTVLLTTGGEAQAPAPKNVQAPAKTPAQAPCPDGKCAVPQRSRTVHRSVTETRTTHRGERGPLRRVFRGRLFRGGCCD